MWFQRVRRLEWRGRGANFERWSWASSGWRSVVRSPPWTFMKDWRAEENSSRAVGVCRTSEQPRMTVSTWLCHCEQA